jgi:phosphatidylglycerol:prolipoprotein diacylglycerol transferase
MYPTLTLPLLDVGLRTSALFIQLGVLFAVIVGPFWAEALEGLDRKRVRWALLVLAILALAGARIHFLVNYHSTFVMSPGRALKLWTGPFHVGGGLAALVLAAPWVTRALGLPLGRFADGIAPSVGVTLAIIRVGCLMQGCCFGDVCAYPWCISYPRGSDVYLSHERLGLVAAGATHSQPVHPLHLYFMAAGLLVAVITLLAHRRKRYDGQPALIGLLVFTINLAVLEFWRTDDGIRIYWGALPQLEWTALALVGAALITLIVAEIRHSRRQRHTARAMAPELSAVEG